MKKFILVVIVGLFSLTTVAQEKLLFALKTGHFSMWNKSSLSWDEFIPTHARFEFYRDENFKVVEVIGYFDSSNDYIVGTTFCVYDTETVHKTNEFMYYFYVYENEEYGTKVSYDKSKFIIIRDKIKEEVTDIFFINYHKNNWGWMVVE